MKVFDDNFPVEFFHLLLLKFNESERRRLAEFPNIARQPNYSRRIRKTFLDLFSSSSSETVDDVLARHRGLLKLVGRK